MAQYIVMYHLQFNQISVIFNTPLIGRTVLLLTIQFCQKKKLNGSKYGNVSLTTELNIGHLLTQS